MNKGKMRGNNLTKKALKQFFEEQDNFERQRNSYFCNSLRKKEEWMKKFNRNLESYLSQHQLNITYKKHA